MSVQKNERLGLLGGSFDPVHNGHLALARAFGSAVEADRVLLLPAKEPPHKPGRKLADERQYPNNCSIVCPCGGRCLPPAVSPAPPGVGLS